MELRDYNAASYFDPKRGEQSQAGEWRQEVETGSGLHRGLGVSAWDRTWSRPARTGCHVSGLLPPGLFLLLSPVFLLLRGVVRCENGQVVALCHQAVRSKVKRGSIRRA